LLEDRVPEQVAAEHIFLLIAHQFMTLFEFAQFQGKEGQTQEFEAAYLFHCLQLTAPGEGRNRNLVWLGQLWGHLFA